MDANSYEEIVNHSGSPILVLAGPGSGKTYLLADRIKRLLDGGVGREKITVITFGKDASQNMIKMLTDPGGDFKLEYEKLPHISTMHSLGNDIVEEKPRAVNLLKTNLRVQENETVKRLLYRDAAFILDFDEKDAKEAIQCKQYGECKKDSNITKCKICNKYWEIMSKCNYIDFDDQILFACNILDNNNDILKKYQNKSQYLLIDEYQDINTNQFRLIELLSRNTRNGLFAVGDDAQSIYSFRGGNPKFILRFEKDYLGAKITTLPISRRCHEKIMEDAFKILTNYYKDWIGKPKLEYVAEIDDAPYVIKASSEIAETKIVGKITWDALKKGQEVLILVPKKDFFPPILNEFKRRGISYDCSNNFLPEKISTIKRFLDWMENYNDNFKTRLIIEDLINFGIAKVPGAKKNTKTCKKETIENRTKEEIKIAKLWEIVDKNNNLFGLIQKHKDANYTLEIINNSLTCLLELYGDTDEKNKGEFLKQLSRTLNIWHKPEEFIKNISDITKLLKVREIRVSKIARVMTMKKAKGLSSDIVIIVGLENDIIPNPKADIAEEARLFYVSMTRAKKKLFLIHSHKRPRNISYGAELNNKPRSQFLDVIGRNSEWRKF